MLIEFYISFVGALADSVEKLADAHEKFPDKYKTIAELERDPGLIEEVAKELSPEEKETLLITIIKLSALARRTNKVFELNVEEKRALVRELRKFAAGFKDLSGSKTK